MLVAGLLRATRRSAAIRCRTLAMAFARRAGRAARRALRARVLSDDAHSTVRLDGATRVAGARAARRRDAPPLRRRAQRAAQARATSSPCSGGRCSTGSLQPLAFWLGFKAVGIDVPWSATLFVQGLIVIRRRASRRARLLRRVRVRRDVGARAVRHRQSDAATWALIFHVASFIPITLIGAYYFARLGLTMGDDRLGGDERAT